MTRTSYPGIFTSTSTIFLLDASGQYRRVAKIAVYGISVCAQITCSRSCTFLAFSHGSELCVCVCVCVCVSVCLCVCVCVCVCVYVFPSLLPVGSCPLQLVWFCLVLQRKTCRNNLRLCISDRRILLTQLEKTLLVIGLESLWCCVFFLGHLYC